MTNTNRIVVLSGSPGTGKTTIARMLAENSILEKTAHIELDDFWEYIRKGYIPPWAGGGGDGGQNETVIEAVALSAEKFSQNGYEVFVAGVIGPWFIEPWLKIAQKAVDVRYIVLRPSEATAVSRATERTQRDFFPLTTEIVKNLWSSFTDLGRYESNAVDTTMQTVKESAALIEKMINEGCFRIL
jgi:chloramphenicol 3-O-phosphotransferase